MRQKTNESLVCQTRGEPLQLHHLFLSSSRPASEKACLRLGDPSDKVNPVEVDSFCQARLVAFFGRPVEEKSA
jgi:hypothetical protein